MACIFPPSCPLPTHSHIYFQVNKYLLYSINNITLNTVFWNFLIHYIRGYFMSMSIGIHLTSFKCVVLHCMTTIIYLTASLCWKVTMLPDFTIKVLLHFCTNEELFLQVTSPELELLDGRIYVLLILRNTNQLTSES